MQLVFMHFLVPLCPPRGKTEYKYRTIGKRLGFPGDSDGKESTCNAGDVSSVPGSGRYPREGIAESKYRTIDRGEILEGKMSVRYFYFTKGNKK